MTEAKRANAPETKGIARLRQEGKEEEMEEEDVAFNSLNPHSAFKLS